MTDLFPKILRERAKALGMTGPDVASKLGINYRRYNFYETGERKPPHDLILDICKVLEISPNQLYGLEPIAENPPQPYQKETMKEVATILLERGTPPAFFPAFFDTAYRWRLKNPDLPLEPFIDGYAQQLTNY